MFIREKEGKYVVDSDREFIEGEVLGNEVITAITLESGINPEVKLIKGEDLSKPVKVLHEVKAHVKPFQYYLPKRALLEGGVSILSAPCLVPEDHKAGLLGWTLYYGRMPFIFGNDTIKPGVCYCELEGTFRPGVYMLQARLFHQPGLLYVSEARTQWVLNEPSHLLECSEYKLIF